MIAQGISLRDALSIARSQGLSVQAIPGTGEVRVEDVRRRLSLRINARRKDAPRCLVLALHRREEAGHVR